MNKLLLVQDIGRWTDGWITYSIYGIVFIALIGFVIYKVVKGKQRRERNKRIRQQDPKERTSD